MPTDPMNLSFRCPGPDVGECVEGAIWLPSDDEGGNLISNRDCPRCGGTGELALPSKFEVCSRCEGRGVHDHDAFSNGISAEDFESDPDFRDDYLAGVYNVPCSVCGGLRVVPTVDEARCDPKELEFYRRHVRAEAEYRSQVEAERRAGA